jgi:hypothetical protein
MSNCPEPRRTNVHIKTNPRYRCPVHPWELTPCEECGKGKEKEKIGWMRAAVWSVLILWVLIAAYMIIVEHNWNLFKCLLAGAFVSLALVKLNV